MSSPSAKVLVNLAVFQAVTSAIRRGIVTDEILERIELANGTTDGVACDKVYSNVEAGIAASTTTSYDLAGGSLKDIDNNTVTFFEVCLIFVRNKRSTAAAFLQVGGHATNGFGVAASGKGFWNALLPNGGNNLSPAMSAAPASDSSGYSWLLLYDPVGVPVTAGTGDILAVITSAVAGSTNAWDIMIIGRSA
jgi:hypothetical protein